MRKGFIISAVIALLITGLLAYFVNSWWYIATGIVLLLFIVGIGDMMQTRHAIMRTYPVFGRMRYWMEALRPKMYQYFVESDIDGRPINRIDRSTIYQRAKQELDTMPFGTQLNVYEEGYEWMSHSIAPKDLQKLDRSPRLTIGNRDCAKPYSASIFNVSAMSFGSLSGNAIEALNAGARIGGFAHNTGEGGISPHHLKYEGDLVWQVGTGYFGCRDENGNFSPDGFVQTSSLPSVKMIELKLSQGAKPGHGGILPAKKNTPEIAAIRHIRPYTTVHSPSFHSAFNTPRELILFIRKLRELSGGKPVGFKLCIGRKNEFIAICKAMKELDIYPDFITVDGAEGGTGAAPQEFSNHVGVPMLDGLAFVHNMLQGFGIRHHIRIAASGKILTGFHLVRAIALGADFCYSARAMMMAVGCIQALQCNTNKCPTGVATQDPQLTVGLVVKDKKQRVANYHEDTVASFVELMGAAGIANYKELTRSHIYRRVFMNEVRTFEDIFPSLEPGCMVNDNIPEKYKQDFEQADINKWN